MKARAIGSLALLTALAGCGSITPITADAGTGAGGAATTGAGGSATGAGGSATGAGGSATGAGGSTVADGGGTDGLPPLAPCANREPVDGANCNREGLLCEYGDDPRGDACRSSAQCTAGKWKVTPNPCTDGVNVGSCSAATVGDTACQTMNSYCARPDGASCLCTNCPPNAPVCGTGAPVWRCPAANMVAGCPAAEPDLGTACMSEGATCMYVCSDPQRVCSRGIWISGSLPTGGCPK